MDGLGSQKVERPAPAEGGQHHAGETGQTRRERKMAIEMDRSTVQQDAPRETICYP